MTDITPKVIQEVRWDYWFVLSPHDYGVGVILAQIASNTSWA